MSPMRKSVRLIAALGLGLFLTATIMMAATPAVQRVQPPAAPYPPAAAPGLYAVAEWTGEWRDASRDRTVPVRIYYPAQGAGPFPVIVFSHGLGGSRDGYRYLGERWASRGYVSVHPQHPGSDKEVLRSLTPFRAMQRAAADPRNALDRPKDISFVIDQLATLNGKAGFPLKGKLDLGRIGVGGHSFGAYTALASAGRILQPPLTGPIDLSDNRIKACVALSAPVKSKERDCPGYAAFMVPCLHMTGTKDDSPIGNTPAALRRIPYDCIPGPDQYLVTFEGGDHMVFSGRFAERPRPNDELFQRLTMVATTAFWDAYLKGDPAAKAYLSGGGFGRLLAGSGALEVKTLAR
jgi:predicted dienelactone hydrolase